MHLCLRVLSFWAVVELLQTASHGLWGGGGLLLYVSVRSFQRCGFSLLSARFLADILALHHLITPLQYWRSNLSTHSLPDHYSSASLFNCFQVAFVFPCTFDSPLVRELRQPAVSMSLEPWLSPNCPLTFCCPSVTVWLTSRLYNESFFSFQIMETQTCVSIIWLHSL